MCLKDETQLALNEYAESIKELYLHEHASTEDVREYKKQQIFIEGYQKLLDSGLCNDDDYNTYMEFFIKEKVLNKMCSKMSQQISHLIEETSKKAELESADLEEFSNVFSLHDKKELH